MMGSGQRDRERRPGGRVKRARPGAVGDRAIGFQLRLHGMRAVFEDVGYGLILGRGRG